MVRSAKGMAVGATVLFEVGIFPSQSKADNFLTESKRRFSLAHQAELPLKTSLIVCSQGRCDVSWTGGSDRGVSITDLLDDIYVSTSIALRATAVQLQCNLLRIRRPS